MDRVVHRWGQGLTRKGAVGVIRNLLAPSLKRGRNVFRPGSRKEFWRTLVFLSFAMIFMLGTWLAARWLFGKFAAVETLAQLLITRTLSLALFFFAGLLIFSNLVSAFTTFFLAPDLELLRAGPTSSRQLYLARYATNWSSTSWSMFLFLLPMFWGAGPALNAPLYFYPVVLIAVVPLTLLCAAVGSITCFVMTRYLPAKRSRDLLILLAIVAFVIGYIAFRLAEPEKFLEPGGFKDLISLITSIESDNQGFSPVYWVTDASLATISGDSSLLFKSMVLLSAAAVGAIYLSTLLCGMLYHRAYTKAHERAPSASTNRERIKRRQWQPKPDPVKAIVQRDYLMFRRTPSQWTQLLLVGALIVVYLLNFKYFQALQDSGILGSLGVYGINFGLSGLVIATLAVRFLFPAISLEGKAFWCLESAPITVDTLLRAKRAWGFPPILVIGSLLCLGAGIITELSPGLVCISLMITALYTWTVCSMSTDLGAFDPQFNLDNPARVASSMTAVVFMLSAMFMLVLLLGLSLQPIWLYERYVNHGYLPSTKSSIIAMVLLITGGLVVWGSMRFTRKLGRSGLARS